MSKLYFIPGLGANYRLFEKQKQSGINFEVIEYIPSLKKESLHEYAARLAEGIQCKEDIILLGVSFGGILAIELAKILPIKKLILISTVKTNKELPFYFKLLRFLKLHFLIPSSWLMRLAHLAKPFFGVQGDEEKMLFTEIIKTTDPEFVKWAIEEVINWKNSTINTSFIHLHGSKDLIFPIAFIQHPIRIANGGHFMIVTHHNELRKYIN